MRALVILFFITLIVIYSRLNYDIQKLNLRLNKLEKVSND